MQESEQANKQTKNNLACINWILNCAKATSVRLKAGNVEGLIGVVIFSIFHSEHDAQHWLFYWMPICNKNCNCWCSLSYTLQYHHSYLPTSLSATHMHQPTCLCLPKPNLKHTRRHTRHTDLNGLTVVHLHNVEIKAVNPFAWGKEIAPLLIKTPTNVHENLEKRTAGLMQQCLHRPESWFRINSFLTNMQDLTISQA